MFLEQALNRALRVSSRATQVFFCIGERILIKHQLTFCEFELLLNVGGVLSFGCLLKARDVLLVGFNAGLQLLDAVNYGLCFRSGGERMRSCIPQGNRKGEVHLVVCKAKRFRCLDALSWNLGQCCEAARRLEWPLIDEFGFGSCPWADRSRWPPSYYQTHDGCS
jgi:hypothetical protein